MLYEKSFKEVANEWLLIKKLSIKNSTYEKYENVIMKHLNKKFDNMNEIDESLVMSYFNDLIESNEYSNSTLKAIRYVLKSILEYSHSRYHFNMNINFNYIKLGKPNNKYNVLTSKQRESLESYCFTHYDNISLAIILALYGGFRVGEVAGLQWSDIDFHNGIISVNRTIERLRTDESSNTKTKLKVLEPKTATSKRIVPMPDFIMEYVKEYYLQHHPTQLSNYVYTNSDKISDPRSIQYHFQKICNSFDFTINFHSLRHTYATTCVMNDVDIKSLSEILGHSNVSITLDIYVHSSLEFKKSQVSKLKRPHCLIEHDVLL